MHPEAYDYLRRTLHSYRDKPVMVLEFGSRDVNGTPRELFTHEYHSYYGVDIEDGPGVDEVANAAHWSKEQAFDVVICAEVFEHTAEWPLIVKQAFACLKPRGVAIFTAATEPRAPHSAANGELLEAGQHAEWYQNIPPEQLESTLRQVGFIRVKVNTHPRGDVYAFGLKEGPLPPPSWWIDDPATRRRRAAHDTVINNGYMSL